MPEFNRWYRRFFGLDKSTPEKPLAPSPKAHPMASAGVELAGGILAFSGLGYLVDRGAGTWPWGLVTGAMLGFAGGMYLLIKAATRGGR